MATTVNATIVKTTDRPTLPALTSDIIIVVADGAGKIYRALPAQVQQVLPVAKNADFAIALKAGQVLEYICLDNANPMDILIGTTPGGSEIRSFINTESITDGQPIALMRYASADETVYITGVAANTKTKIKIS